MQKRGRKKILLATVLVLVVIGGVAGFFFYAPSNVQLSIKDPPQQPYDPTIQAIFVTFTSIDIHTANSADNTGWHTLASNTTVNLFTVLNVSKVLNKAMLPLENIPSCDSMSARSSLQSQGSMLHSLYPADP